MSALVRVFGVPQSWARIVPGAAVTALVGLSVTLMAVPPAAGLPARAQAETTAETTPPQDGEPLTAADAVSAAVIARLEGETVEILGERTESGSVYALPDGSRAAGLGAGPVWVHQGGDGTSAEDWAPVDLTLELGEDGLVRPVAQSASLVLSGGTTPAEAAAAAASSVVEETARTVTAPGPENPAASPSPSVAAIVASTPQPSSTPDATPTPTPTADVTPAPSIGQAVPTPSSAEEPAARTQIASVTDPATGVVTSVQWDGTLPEPHLEGRRATYEEVEPGIDLVLEATSTGFEQFFVVHERPAAGADLSFPLTISTDGAPVTVGEDGSLSVQTPAGEAVGRAGVPYMWDAHSDAGRPYPVTQARPEEPRGGLLLPPMPDFTSADSAGEPAGDAPVTGPELVGDVRIDPLAEAVEIDRDVRAVAVDEVAIDLVPSQDFLQDPATQFPVVVDPAYDIFNGFDTYVLKGFGNDRSQETELRIGTYNGGTNVARSFVHFPTANFANKVVHEAWLNLYNFQSWSCSPRAWTVHASGPASPATTWANQPGQGLYQYAISDETLGYGECASGYSSVDVTKLAKDWAAQGLAEGYVTVRAANEADNFAYKRFFSANNGGFIPGIWVKYNDLPAPPSNLTVSDSPNGTAAPAVTRTLTPTLSATITDPDSFDWAFGARFLIQKTSDGSVVHTAEVNGVPNGGVAQLKIPAGLLQDWTNYTWSVWSRDLYGENPQRSGPRTFTTDVKAPLAPAVSSSVYPADGKWHGPENTAATFALTPPPGTDITLHQYRWGLDKAPDPNNAPVTLPVTGGGPPTVTVPAASMTTGRHSLRVQAVDVAGNTSAVVEHVFYVGRGGIVAPVTDTRVVSRARLFVTGDPVFTHVRFEFKRGLDVPDAATTNPADDVPAGDLTTSTGGVWTPSPLWGYAPLPGNGPTPAASSYTTWNVAQTLGHVGGPVLVRAVLAKNDQGLDAYKSAWITLTVDPNADGAASTGVGPGAVNLLTGDHTLSVTDAEEFGLALARTTSSRDTASGYQLQEEKLHQAHREGSSTTNLSGTAAVTIDTTRFHAGGKSFKVTPPSTASDDTFMSLAGDTGGMRLGFQPGRSYRVSGWVYVPSATGLAQTNSRALGLNVFTKVGSAAYVERRTLGLVHE